MQENGEIKPGCVGPAASVARPAQDAQCRMLAGHLSAKRRTRQIPNPKVACRPAAAATRGALPRLTAGELGAGSRQNTSVNAKRTRETPAMEDNADATGSMCSPH